MQEHDVSMEQDTQVAGVEESHLLPAYIVLLLLLLLLVTMW